MTLAYTLYIHSCSVTMHMFWHCKCIPVFHIRQFSMLPNYHYLVTAFGELASSLCSCYTVVCFNLWIYSYCPRCRLTQCDWSSLLCQQAL